MTDEEIEIFQRGLRAVAGHYGLLVAKRVDQAVVSAATATFVRIGDRPLIITAGHVVDGLRKRGAGCLQVPSGSIAETAEVPRSPIEIEVILENCLDLRAESGFDIAVIPAPVELRVLPHVGWFDADLQMDIVAQLRCDASINPSQPLGCMILGYPLFPRFFAPGARVQVFGSFPLWGAIENFPSLSPVGARAPQVAVEVELPKPEELPSNVHGIVRTSIENFCAMERSSSEHANEPWPVAGYSGGPLVCFCKSGNYLLGIIKEFGICPGCVAYAVPIDVVVERVRASNLMQRT